MTKTKFYAIKNTNQVVTTWAECEAIVKGLSKAEYKGFKTQEEAEDYLNDVESAPIKNEVISYTAENGIFGTIRVAEDVDPFDFINPNQYGAVYAVDGSFNKETSVYGAGVALYGAKDCILESKRISGSKPEFASARNIAGEVVAFATAITMAVEKKQTSIVIICDYEGDFRWTAPKSVVINGQACWGNKQGSPIAVYHAKALDYAKNNGITNIGFIWVRGHKGVDSNELVDKLAKQACGIE